MRRLLWVASGRVSRSVAAKAPLVSVAGSGIRAGRIPVTASTSTPPAATPSFSTPAAFFALPASTRTDENSPPVPEVMTRVLPLRAQVKPESAAWPPACACTLAWMAAASAVRRWVAVPPAMSPGSVMLTVTGGRPLTTTRKSVCVASSRVCTSASVPLVEVPAGRPFSVAPGTSRLIFTSCDTPLTRSGR